MSVVAMKLVTLAGPLERFDAVVRDCIVGQEFQPENALGLMKDVTGLRPCECSNPFTPLLRRAEALAEQLGISLEYQDPVADSFTEETAEARLSALETDLAELRQAQSALQQEASDNDAIVDQLANLQGFSANLTELRSLTYLRFRYGHMPRETYDSFKDAINDREDTFFFATSVGLHTVYAIYFTTKAAHDEVDSLFNSLHYSRILIDDRVGGTADDAISAFTQRGETARQQAADVEAKLVLMKCSQQPDLCALWSWLHQQSDMREVRRYAARSKDTFYLTGWVPKENLSAFTGHVEQSGGLSLVADDAEDVTSATPPTKLKNNFFARIYEPFLMMYGLPAYNELDPSLFMAITYTLFFGIMFGDLGQGLCLAVVGFVLARWKKMWLGNIMTCCGLSGAIFGCVYGSVFGFEDILPGFKILEHNAAGGSNVMTLLILSITLGVVMLVFVMGLNVINGIRQHNWEKIIFGSNGLAGMTFYIGLLVMFAGSLLLDWPLMTPLYVVPVIVLPLALILLREPLCMLVTGDPGWKKCSIGSILGTGFFELFEVLLSYLTNTLSFLRIGAYAITHVGLMMVIQALAGSGNIVILVLGNIFVMGFEGLLVGIQVLRLEFYELFGRFYDDGGTPYQPMNHVDPAQHV